MSAKFLVKNTQSNGGALSLNVLLNNETKYMITQCVEPVYEFNFDIVETSKIRFVVGNKQPEHTIVSNGQIIKDTFLQIENISINDISVMDSINLFSNYFTEANGVLRTNGFLTFNGDYVFKFRYPLSNHLTLCDYYTPAS